jgi:hypothetical protein
LAVASAGAGHGHYEFARLFFPYTMLLTRLTGDSIGLPLILLGLGQFSLYGAMVGMCRNKIDAASAVLAIFIIHALAVFACFSGLIPNFS